MIQIANPERPWKISNFEARSPNKGSLFLHSTMEIQILFQHWNPQDANYGFGTDVRGNVDTFIIHVKFRFIMHLTKFAYKPVDRRYF